ncbi:hypothetical protein Tco_1507741 [Tanacetum coccineum]
MLSTMNLIHVCWKDSILQAGNPVKEILFKLNLPDHRILKDGGEVKEYQERWLHSLSNIKNSMSISVQKSQDHMKANITRWRIEIMLG